MPITEKQSEYSRQWYLRNRERLKPIRKAYREANREKMRPYYKRYEKENAVKIAANKKAFALANPDKIRERRKRYKHANRENILARQREYNAKPATKEHAREYKRQRRLYDPAFRIRSALHARVRIAIKKQYGLKSRKTMELIGCNISFLRQYIEARFTDGMSWQNHGFNVGTWSIDHVIPCAKFNLTDPDQQRQCFHYSNMQPMWHEENRRKSASLPPPHQAELL